MPRILEFFVGEICDAGRWRGPETYAQTNTRLVDAIVRRFIENEIRHETYKRVNIALSPNGPSKPQISPSRLSPKWVDATYGISSHQFNSMTATENERQVAAIIFDSAIALFGQNSEEAPKIQSIRCEFEAYYDSKFAIFHCRSKTTKRYNVDITFSINWGPTPPFWIGFVEYQTIGANPIMKRVSFELRGTDNDIFELCGRIAVQKGEIVLHPRPAHISHLRDLKYDIPMRIEIQEMENV